MAILKKKSTCNNLFDLLLRGSLVWFLNCIAFSMVLSNLHMFGLEHSATLSKRSEVDHFGFYCHTSFGKCVYLMVYVVDIVIMCTQAI